MAKVLTTIAVLALSVLGKPLVSFAKTELTEAHVTRIIREVQLLPEQAAPHPAALQDMVRGGTAIRTGVDSRTELTFPDQTLARLGANTVFSFSGGTRALDLGGGAMLLYVPKGSGGAKILTAAVTAAITGTTVLIEYHPPRQAAGAHRRKDFSSPNRGVKKNDLSSNSIKFITLEGVARIYIKGRPGEPILVPAGKELVISPDGSSYDLVEVNVEELVKTSQLITDFSPLPSYPLIVEEIQRQRDERIAGEMMETEGVALRDPFSLDTVDQSFAALPPPSQFGTPSTITSPNPYLITSGTIITTGPSINTNGVTDFGKIYRGRTEDGAFTLWAFGSTSTFDNTIGFNSIFANISNLPIALFKFKSLSLIGNPTIDLGNGSVTKLGLIGVDGITSGPPGGTLTLTGLDTLLLATVNGSINLTSDISFDGISSIFIYARGAGSTLTLASPILNSNSVFLASQGSMNLIVGMTTHGSLTFLSGGDLVTAANSGQFTVDNMGGTISSASIALQVGGGINAAGPLNTTINNTGGVIGNNASLNVSAANVSANSLLADISNNGGGLVSGNANLNFGLSGNLTTQGDANFLLDNFNGGTIGGNANLQVSAANFTLTNAAGSLLVGIDNRNNGSGTGGSIGGNATVDLNVANTLSSGGAASILIGNEGDAAGFPGGTIGGDATINVSAANITANSLLAQIDNTGGSIGGNATINMDVSGNTSITTDATVEILGNNPSGSAAINFNGGSYAIGSPGIGGMFLGFITGNGTIAFNNASVRADVIRAGVFGPNGVLNVGGGTLSADSILKLYAPGSNGQLNFVSNVTLGGAAAKILAANSVTIFNNVVVTIGGPNSADVYTNNANYTGFGGNGTTTGTFAGAGANEPQPLSSAPPFNAPPPGHPNRATRTGPAINVNDTAELLALLDATSAGPNGRAIVGPGTAQRPRAVDPGAASRRAATVERAEMKNGRTMRTLLR